MFPTNFSDHTDNNSSDFDGFGDSFGDFHSASDSFHEDMTASSSTNSWGALSTGSTASEGAWSVTSDTVLELSGGSEAERTSDALS